MLPKPFKVGNVTLPDSRYTTAYIVGLFSGGYMAYHISMPYLVHPEKYIRTISIITALSIAHILAYPLAKHALQWHIDRSGTFLREIDSDSESGGEHNSYLSDTSDDIEEDQISTPSETTNSSDADPDLPSHSTDDYGMTENYETGHYTARVHHLRKLCIHSTRDF